MVVYNGRTYLLRQVNAPAEFTHVEPEGTVYVPHLARVCEVVRFTIFGKKLLVVRVPHLHDTRPSIYLMKTQEEILDGWT